MSISSGHVTHIGPPAALGGGIPDFNATTKVVAYTTADYPLTLTPQLIAYPDIRLDTKDEFDGSYFTPAEDGWYAIGGKSRFIGLTGGGFNAYVQKIYKDSGSTDIAEYENAPGGSTSLPITIEYQGIFYVTRADAINFRNYSVPVGGILQGSVGYVYMHINRVL